MHVPAILKQGQPRSIWSKHSNLLDVVGGAKVIPDLLQCSLGLRVNWDIALIEGLHLRWIVSPDTIRGLEGVVDRLWIITKWLGLLVVGHTSLPEIALHRDRQLLVVVHPLAFIGSPPLANELTRRQDDPFIAILCGVLDQGLGSKVPPSSLEWNVDCALIVKLPLRFGPVCHILLVERLQLFSKVWICCLNISNDLFRTWNNAA